MIDYVNDELFQKSGVHKQLQIAFSGGTITNKELYSEQFSMTESISSGNVLSFGNCEASSVKFRIRNLFDSLVGQSLSVSMILNRDTDNPLILGMYKGYSDTPTADRKYRDVVAYDAMYDIINADVTEWYNSLLFPMSLRDFRQSFAWNFGLDQVDADLVNDTLTVERTIIADKISGKTILTAICQINGCFGHINRTGQLEYVRLKNRGTAEISQYRTPLKYENYVVQPITKVQIRQEEGDVGGSFGDGDNLYVVEDNFLTFGMEQADLELAAERLLSEIGGISYCPCNVTTVGNPCIEVGDAITIHSSDMDIVSVVLSRTISGIQALKDTYTSSGEQKRSQQLNSAKEELRKLKAKANIFTRSLEETRSEIYELEKELHENYSTSEEIRSEVKQTAEEVSTTVAKTAIEEMTIGARNLIRNSRTMVFADYFFGAIGDFAALVTETGAQLITEDGRILII